MTRNSHCPKESSWVLLIQLNATDHFSTPSKTHTITTESHSYIGPCSSVSLADQLIQGFHNSDDGDFPVTKRPELSHAYLHCLWLTELHKVFFLFCFASIQINENHRQLWLSGNYTIKHLMTKDLWTDILTAWRPLSILNWDRSRSYFKRSTQKQISKWLTYESAGSRMCNTVFSVTRVSGTEGNIWVWVSDLTHSAPWESNTVLPFLSDLIHLQNHS